MVKHRKLECPAVTTHYTHGDEQKSNSANSDFYTHGEERMPHSSNSA